MCSVLTLTPNPLLLGSSLWQLSFDRTRLAHSDIHGGDTDRRFHDLSKCHWRETGTPGAVGDIIWPSGEILHGADDFLSLIDADSILHTFVGTPDAPGVEIFSTESETAAGRTRKRNDKLPKLNLFTNHDDTRLILL